MSKMMNVPKPAGEGVKPVQAGTGGKPGASPQSPLHAQLGDHSSSLLARVKSLGQARIKVTKVQGVLEGLLDKGDTIQLEDVVSASGDIVAAGIDPVTMASILATMPTAPQGSAPGNPQLEAWVAQYAQSVEGKLAALNQADIAAHHELGVAALRQLAGHSLRDPPEWAPPEAPSPAPEMAGAGPEPMPAPAPNELASAAQPEPAPQPMPGA